MNNVKYQKIILKADRYELNPLLDKEKNGKLSVFGIGDDGEEYPIPNDKIRYHVYTVYTNGNAEVASVSENGEIVPLNGGMVKIGAEYRAGGLGFHDEISVVVRPFYHEYHKTLTYKLFMAMEPYASLWKPQGETRDESVFLDYDEVLDIIRRLDNITNGMPKIVYLVGWQRGGHDHLYPSFAEVNPKLKGKYDKDAREGLRRVMREAKAYHTTVSLHINLIDAWEDSPLWDLYHEKHILAEVENGEIDNQPEIFGADFAEKNGIRVGRVEMTPLWNTGEFENRMNELFTLVPELWDAHTIHIDNWRCEPCPALGITREDEEATIRKIFGWFRERGLDATSEGSMHGRSEPMTGLQPMAWWLSEPYDKPESLYAGGRRNRCDTDPRFGDTILVEGTVRENQKRGRDLLAGLQDEYCLYTLPWEFLHHFRLLSFDGTTAVYSDGVRATFRNGQPVIEWNDAMIRNGSSMFVPLLFAEEREMVIYTFRDGYYYIRFPENWADVQSVDFYYLDPLGKKEPQLERENVPLNDRKINFPMEPRCAYLVKPHIEKT